MKYTSGDILLNLYADQITNCKVCNSKAPIVGLVDFSRCGLDVMSKKKVTPYSGVPIYYYECEACGFVFSRALDRWTDEQFAEYIYNEEYALHDPDYIEVRPKVQAEIISSFPSEIRNLTILDFGSGLGILERELKNRGFKHVDSYDPFTNKNKLFLDQQKYDIVFAFEVFEHHPNPIDLFEQIRGCLKPNGVLIFSTLTINKQVTQEGLSNWWYCTPRNGHISFYSVKTLLQLANMYKFECFATIRGDEWHLMFNHNNRLWVDFLKVA